MSLLKTYNRLKNLSASFLALGKEFNLQREREREKISKIQQNYYFLIKIEKRVSEVLKDQNLLNVIESVIIRTNKLSIKFLFKFQKYLLISNCISIT